MDPARILLFLNDSSIQYLQVYTKTYLKAYWKIETHLLNDFKKLDWKFTMYQLLQESEKKSVLSLRMLD